MDSITTLCNECKHEFQLNEFKHEMISEQVEKTFFTCPSCHTEYLCFVTDETIRQQQEEIRKLREKVITVTQQTRQLKLYKRIIKLQKDIKDGMDLLKKQVEARKQ